ncbi:hypothetical protein GCM10023091_12470 [Ravibacter arvi]|uniref:Polymerase/histidinol phosphatase N-terminal domain-containing protein n=1 Tax=Ravibacter arvi TaxID=2051041 RepID=A0ABP8LSG3_9BACT
MPAEVFLGFNALWHRVRRTVRLAAAALFILYSGEAAGQTVFAAQEKFHLRYGNREQWADIGRGLPVQPYLELVFSVPESSGDFSMFIRQYGVMHDWVVVLNDSLIGKLEVDEKEIVTAFSLAPGILSPGKNKLRIAAMVKAPYTDLPNDILVSDIIIEKGRLPELLSESELELELTDRLSKLPMPGRFTIVDRNGGYVPLGISAGTGLALRPGFVYTADGKATVPLRAGTYTVYATRGFEYGVDSSTVTVEKGKTGKLHLRIAREVETSGLVSSDPHVHTYSYSRHGDATVAERVVTLAGEHLEMPVATDHNVYADLSQAIDQAGVGNRFTVVDGMELTTRVGHFNIFPVDRSRPVPDYGATDWTQVTATTAKIKGLQVMVFNHPRDIHAGFRPFDPKLHVAAAGWNRNGWEIAGNAMELINSGAHQSQMMRPVEDWFGLINSGRAIAGVGSSDSHTVSRYLVGQARTYVRGNDELPGNLDTKTLLRNFAKGRTMVAFGLLTEITVNRSGQAGDTIRVGNREVEVKVQVSGPSWVSADSVALYANGVLIREAAIGNGKKAGLKSGQTWRLPALAHDVFLVAVAWGRGERKQPYWQIARPYQQSSPAWNPVVMGISGVVYAATGKTWTSAGAYARKLVSEYGAQPRILFHKARKFDQAVGIQIGRQLHKRGVALDEIVRSAEEPDRPVMAGVRRFWKELEQPD